jgi:cellulose biosynthesis protein BcsQ
VRSRADVVVVDCPPGLTGIAGEVVAACTHVVGVVRSDRAASTAATALEGHIDGLAAERGPQLTGIIVNLFDGRSVPSIDAFGRIAQHGVPMFETTIPRADVLAEDSDDEQGALSWLFDTLATEVAARSGLDEQRATPALTLTAATAGLSWLPR